MNTTERILLTLRAQVAEIAPDVDPSAVAPGANLEQLGCSSIDRAEITVMTMQELDVVLDPHELAVVHDVSTLLDALARKLP